VLFEPWPLGGRVARNRVLFGPHVTNLGRGRCFSPAHAAYYARRARGGVGVVVTETISVHESDWPYERAPLASECAASLAAVAEAISNEGALAIASLGHAGLQGSTAYSQGALWAPSLVPNVVTHEMPYVLEDADIAELLAAAARAATDAMSSGCAGVELNAGQHSLFRQFASGLTNTRTDQWGERARFVATAMEQLRIAIGEGVLGLRFAADELAPWAGITPEIARALLPHLAERADYVVIERGGIFSEAATRPDMHEPANFNRGLLESVTDAVPPSAACVGQGSILDVATAEQLLADGLAGAVEMTRALIADPDALLEGSGSPRPCVLCNQGCQVRDVRNPLVSCAVNPEAGHELDEPDLTLRRARPSQRSFVVAGGGVAGLEAAWSLSATGATVSLRERSGSLGGDLRLAAALPGRDRWRVLIAWYEAELAARGVEISLHCDVAPATAVDIAAVGGQDRALVLRDGDDGSVPIHSVRAVLEGAELSGRIVVVDPVGGPVGVGVAEALAGRGCVVTMVTPDLIVGNQLALTGDLVAANRRVAIAGVIVVTHAVPVAVNGGRLRIEDRYSGEIRELALDAVVDAGFAVPHPVVWAGVMVGDAVAPRSVGAAILEGRRAAFGAVGGPK
jgi:2,4-dienoyl-CoA reductase-like NADH-dependent reductase (Old Yellow Enzyme family)